MNESVSQILVIGYSIQKSTLRKRGGEQKTKDKKPHVVKVPLGSNDHSIVFSVRKSTTIFIVISFSLK